MSKTPSCVVGLTGAEHKRPSELSDGMKQRIGIARALLITPKIMLITAPAALCRNMASRRGKAGDANGESSCPYSQSLFAA
jgi:ABC-type taurine transport system ATPase subunit